MTHIRANNHTIYHLIICDELIVLKTSILHFRPYIKRHSWVYEVRNIYTFVNWSILDSTLCTNAHLKQYCTTPSFSEYAARPTLFGRVLCVVLAAIGNLIKCVLAFNRFIFGWCKPRICFAREYIRCIMKWWYAYFICIIWRLFRMVCVTYGFNHHHARLLYANPSHTF